jgi:hypothetical protein
MMAMVVEVIVVSNPTEATMRATLRRISQFDIGQQLFTGI